MDIDMNTFVTGGLDGLLAVWEFKRIPETKRMRPDMALVRAATQKQLKVPALKAVQQDLVDPRVGSCTGRFFNRLPDDRGVSHTVIDLHCPALRVFLNSWLVARRRRAAQSRKASHEPLASATANVPASWVCAEVSPGG